MSVCSNQTREQAELIQLLSLKMVTNQKDRRLLLVGRRHVSGPVLA